MFCSHCGKQIPDDAKFCPVCGTKVVKNTQNKQKVNPMDLLEHKSSDAYSRQSAYSGQSARPTRPAPYRSAQNVQRTGNGSLVWKVAFGFVIVVIILISLSKGV